MGFFNYLNFLIFRALLLPDGLGNLGYILACFRDKRVPRFFGELLFNRVSVQCRAVFNNFLVNLALRDGI